MTREIPANLPDDILWGGAAIAEYLNREKRSVYYLAAHGLIPVTKLGRRIITARKSELDAHLRNRKEAADADA